ncbi:hypothetical protein QOZ80_1BG0091880 [Eleusine coracana subsp. coracana]|nr:hypothetical protein QOZ80_1BG0091880 [Eleusine coracana subsp. coracana]
METLCSSTPGDGTSSPKEADATVSPGKNSSDDDGDDGSNTYPEDLKFYHLLGYPDYDSFFQGLREELFDGYVTHLAGRLRPIADGDNVKQFCDLCCAWPQYLSARGLILPEIIVSLVSHNALRCTRAVLQRTAPQLRGYEVDLNVRHLYGFAPLHVAAEAFNVDMVQLLLRHGASANIHTKGPKVIEGLLPLHVAVQNAAIHKYLEDHWADGDPVENLIFLLCLPEMVRLLVSPSAISPEPPGAAAAALPAGSRFLLARSGRSCSPSMQGYGTEVRRRARRTGDDGMSDTVVTVVCDIEARSASPAGWMPHLG